MRSRFPLCAKPPYRLALARSSVSSSDGRQEASGLLVLRDQCDGDRAYAAEAVFSARCFTPRNMSRDITKSAGTTPSHPLRVNHQGCVTHRDRKVVAGAPTVLDG